MVAQIAPRPRSGLGLNELLDRRTTESEMRDDQARVAMADAMQLHNDRLAAANAEVRRLRAELESAVIRQDQVRDARLHFMRYVAPGCAAV